MSLQQKLCQLTLIEDWYKSTVTNQNLLHLMGDALGAGQIFGSIYVSIRRNPTDAASEGDIYDYYNVGSDAAQITEYFYTRFGANYFAYNYNSFMQYTELKNKINSIYQTNLYKYRKLIEIMGFKYNPLYNVDGVELYARAESIGDGESSRTPSGTISTVTGTDNNGTISDTTTTNYKNPYDANQIEQTANVEDTKSTQTAITTKQSFEDNYTEQTQVKNIPAYNYKYNQQTGKWEQDGLFTINAKDNAFGAELTGPERYYTEKRIRQGNIGVTKTTELLQSQRELIRFNILDEFFEDLQRDIVVGIY